MRTTQQFSITLPHDMAEAVESKIKSGAYASVSEVVRDGLHEYIAMHASEERADGYVGRIVDFCNGSPHFH